MNGITFQVGCVRGQRLGLQREGGGVQNSFLVRHVAARSYSNHTRDNLFLATRAIT